MAVAQNPDKIQTILSYLKSLEEYSKNKSNEAYGKSVLEKQKICVFNLLENRELEEKILEALLQQIRIEEQRIKQINNPEYIASLAKFRSKELNLESIFKKEIQLMKVDLRELFKIFELQKDLTGEKYLESVQKEFKLIADFKELITNVLNSQEQIRLYLKQLSLLTMQNKSNQDYEYMGLHVPGNIKLLDPISKYDLEPFLEAYKKYRSELANVIIQLKYSGMTADFMRSQYQNDFLFHKAEDRKYIMLISDNRNESKGVTMNRMAYGEKVGWYAHEFRHILWYSTQSNMSLLGFTAKYGVLYGISFIPGLKKFAFSYLSKAEQETDSGAIAQGAGYDLAQGRNYFFNTSNAPEDMKNRYAKIYTSTHNSMDKTSQAYFDKLNGSRIKK